MSRRPRAVVEQVLTRRLGTMAPGGLLASESPVRRHEGALRPPRAGGGGAPSAAPPAFVGWDYMPCDGGSTTFDMVYSGVGGLTGRAVTVLAGRDTATLSLPSGWVSLLSGSVGHLDYVVGWKDVAVGVAEVATATPAVVYAGSPFDYTGYASASTIVFTSDGRTPTAALGGSGSGVSSFALPTGSGTSNGWAATPVANNTIASPGSWPTYARNQPDVINHGHGRDTAYDAPAVEAGTVVQAVSVDWVTFLVGWA